MAYVGQEPNGSFTTNVSKDTFDGDGSTTAFTLTEGASTNTVDVFVENVRQEPTEAYSVDGTTLTFTAAPPTGTGNIYVVNKSPVRLQAAHPAGLALEAHSATISTDLTVGGTVDIQGNELILDADGDTSITSDTDDVIDFRTAGSDRWQILANGNLKAATDGLGIDFSASEGSGASSSVLDDYEEGTYTVTVTPSTSGSITLASSVNLLAYTKVGRQVTITGRFQISSVSSPVGVARISLPFTVAAGSEQSDYTAFNILTHDVNLPADFVQGFAESDAGISYASMYYTRDNQAWAPLLASQFDGAGAEFIYITGTFLAA